MRTKLFLTSTLLVFAMPVSAMAMSKYISSPSITPGEIALKNRGSVEWSNNDDTLWRNKTDLEYGVNLHFKVGIGGEIRKQEHESLEYHATEVKGVYKFTDESSSLQAAIQGSYEIAHEGNADEIEAKLLLAGAAFGLDHKANFNLSHEIGDDADNDLGFAMAWGSYYDMNGFDIGGEYYGDYGDLGDNNDFGDQEHHIGPVVGFDIPVGTRTIGTRLGYLIGISDEASDNVIKYELQTNF